MKSIDETKMCIKLNNKMWSRPPIIMIFASNIFIPCYKILPRLLKDSNHVSRSHNSSFHFGRFFREDIAGSDEAVFSWESRSFFSLLTFHPSYDQKQHAEGHTDEGDREGYGHDEGDFHGHAHYGAYAQKQGREQG